MVSYTKNMCIEFSKKKTNVTKTKWSIPQFLIIKLGFHDVTGAYSPTNFFSKKTTWFKFNEMKTNTTKIHSKNHKNPQ